METPSAARLRDAITYKPSTHAFPGTGLDRFEIQNWQEMAMDRIEVLEESGDAEPRLSVGRRWQPVK
jgi:hypothetical protein